MTDLDAVTQQLDAGKSCAASDIHAHFSPALRRFRFIARAERRACADAFADCAAAAGGSPELKLEEKYPHMPLCPEFWAGADSDAGFAGASAAPPPPPSVESDGKPAVDVQPLKATHSNNRRIARRMISPRL